MLIDPFTIIAQAINFLILIFLLWKFLYHPVINMIDKREAEIKNRIEKAEEKDRQAEHKSREYEEKLEDIEDRKKEILEKASSEAEEKKRSMLKEAREEVSNAKHMWLESVEREKEAFLRNLRRRSTENLFEIARKVLQDLSGDEVEKNIVKVFTEKLESMEDGDRKELVSSLDERGGNVEIVSSFGLDDKTREEISDRVKDVTGDKAEISFSTDDELIAGIQLKVEGYQVGWNVGDYLESLEENIRRTLNREISIAGPDEKEEIERDQKEGEVLIQEEEPFE